MSGQTLALLAQESGDSLAVLIGGGVLVLWVAVLVKFFQVASDVRVIRGVLEGQHDAPRYDDDEDDDDSTEAPAGLLTEAAQLREFGRLRDEGLLTEDEFANLKTGLLAR